MRPPIAALVAVASTAAFPEAPLSAQAGGFVPGELVLYSTAVQGISSVDGAIVRIDPQTGQASMLFDLLVTANHQGSLAYDAFRDRLVFCGGFTAAGLPSRVYTLDGLGTAQDLGLGNRTLFAFAPGCAGRIYYADAASLSTAPFKYLDAGDVEHVLMDSTGAQPFVLGSPMIVTMAYDPATNALFVASSGGAFQACTGGTATANNVRKLPLSSDGSRVDGLVTCAQFTVDSTSGANPVGFTRTSAGQLLLIVDTNSNGAQPRMVLVDPPALALSAFASNEHAGDAATNAGAYSSARGEAVVLDTSGGVLRAFAQGASGSGTVVIPSMQISDGGSSGEVATLIEIPIGACGTNNVALHCTAKTTSGGCVPVITTSGGPSMSVPSGFTITAGQVEPGKSGLFFYGLSGPNAASFQGGFLCVKPPTRRTGLQNSGGAAACSGALLFDFNAWLAGGNDPLVGAGTQVDGQFWFRDPASPSTTGLSAGVEFTVCP